VSDLAWAVAEVLCLALIACGLVGAVAFVAYVYVSVAVAK
jgi:hypothetical protein